MTGITTTAKRELDVAVIGGGQARLAMAWHLTHERMRFVVLDAGPEIGHTWRSRWDSLTLFTPARYDALPGMPFPGPPDSYPSKDTAASYLKTYAAAFSLPVRLCPAPISWPGHSGVTAHPLRDRRHVRAYRRHDGLHKYPGRARCRAVDAHDGRNVGDDNKRAPPGAVAPFPGGCGSGRFDDA
jgi:choline dehydrogenase-like flavoprotein